MVNGEVGTRIKAESVLVHFGEFDNSLRGICNIGEPRAYSLRQLLGTGIPPFPSLPSTLPRGGADFLSA
jgi:hypothetical protein